MTASRILISYCMRNMGLQALSLSLFCPLTQAQKHLYYSVWIGIMAINKRIGFCVISFHLIRVGFLFFFFRLNHTTKRWIIKIFLQWSYYQKKNTDDHASVIKYLFWQLSLKIHCVIHRLLKRARFKSDDLHRDYRLHFKSNRKNLKIFKRKKFASRLCAPRAQREREIYIKEYQTIISIECNKTCSYSS